MIIIFPWWGNTDLIYIENLAKLQKKAIRAITFSDYKAPSKPLLKELKILTFSDILKHQIASLMWDLDHDTLPASLSTYFTERRNDHNHLTRMATSGKLTIKKYNTNKYGYNSFQIQGALTLNELKGNELYNNATSKKCFLFNLKESFLDYY